MKEVRRVRTRARLVLFAEFCLVVLAASRAGAQTAQTGNVFNPNISVIGNALGIAGHNPVDDQPSLQLQESEIGLQAIVDPYARADFFVTFGSQKGDVGVEEGYITFLTVPGDFVVKVGRLKGAFGKLNTEHPHVRSFADAPLVMTNLLGGPGRHRGRRDLGLAPRPDAGRDLPRRRRRSSFRARRRTSSRRTRETTSSRFST